MASIVDDFCNQLGATPVRIPLIRFTSGLRIGPTLRFARPAQGKCDVVDDLNQMLAPAMASLRPLFVVIAVLYELMRCMSMLPTRLTQPTKLNKFLGCMARLFPRLLELLQELAGLIPPLAIPVLVMDILRAVLTLLDCVLEMLTGIQSLATMVADTLAAPENARQRLLAQCVQQNIDTQLGNLAQAMAALVTVLCMVKSLLSLVPGGDEVAEDLPPNPESTLDALSVATDIGAFRELVQRTRNVVAAIVGDPGTAALAGIAAFVPQGTKASLLVSGEIDPATGDPNPDGSVYYQAKVAGEAGNDIEVRMGVYTPGGPGDPHPFPHAWPTYPIVTVVGARVTVDLETDAGGNPTSIANNVIAHVSEHPDAAALVFATRPPRPDGTPSDGTGRCGTTQDAGYEHLDGGVDAPTLTLPVLGGEPDSFTCGQAL